MKIIYGELPKPIKERIRNFLSIVRNLHPDRSVRFPGEKALHTTPTTNPMVRATNDYSTTVIQFYNIRYDKVIPIRDKLPEVPRKSVGIKEYGGALSFDGLGDSYNLDYGTYYEKLARGISVSLSRQEIMLVYNVEYQKNYLKIVCSPDSPILNKQNIQMNYSDMTTGELVGMSIFLHKKYNPSYKIQDKWREIFGEDSWTYSNEIIKKLLNRKLLKEEKIPKLTLKGTTFMSNLIYIFSRFGGPEYDIPTLDIRYGNNFSEIINWYKMNKGKKLEDLMRE